MAAVEARLGVILLEKKSRKGILTPFGARMLALAEAVLKELDEFLTDTDRIKNSKDIRLASITSIGPRKKALWKKPTGSASPKDR
jgi:DNA-binding transcriptional LysR family regulator